MTKPESRETVLKVVDCHLERSEKSQIKQKEEIFTEDTFGTRHSVPRPNDPSGFGTFVTTSHNNSLFDTWS